MRYARWTGSRPVLIDPSTWLTVRQATRLLDVNQSTISRLIATGRLHAVRTALGFFLDPQSVAEYQTARAARKRPA